MLRTQPGPHGVAPVDEEDAHLGLRGRDDGEAGELGGGVSHGTPSTQQSHQRWRHAQRRRGTRLASCPCSWLADRLRRAGSTAAMGARRGISSASGSGGNRPRTSNCPLPRLALATTTQQRPNRATHALCRPAWLLPSIANNPPPSPLCVRIVSSIRQTILNTYSHGSGY